MSEVWLKGVDAGPEQVGGLFDAAGAKDPLGAGQVRYFGVRDSSGAAPEDFSAGEIPVDILTEGEINNCKDLANAVMAQTEFEHILKVSFSPDEIRVTREFIKQVEQAAKSLPRGISPCYVLGVASVA